MSRLLLSAVIAATSLAVLAPAPARAETFDKSTYLTFSGTVQIPGATLGAGTYRFHLTNPETSRNVMQVMSGDGAIVYAMFHTIPDVRTVVTPDPIVTFREVPANVPPPVKTLFYGGETIGYEFLYGKDEIDLTPQTWPQPPITYTPLPSVRIVPAPEPVSEPEAAVQAAIEPVELAAEPVVAPAELPKTATRLPSVALGGLTLLAAGLGLALARRGR